MEWSGSRRKLDVILVFLFTSPCPEQSKLPVSEDFRDSKCLIVAN